MTQIFTALSASLDGFIAGPDDGPGQPLGKGGTRLFDWYSDGDTPSRYYESFKLSASSAEVFDAMAGRVGAVISGRRTYDISNAWGGKGPLPGAPLFVLTHRVPQYVPPGEPAYTFVTDGIASAVAQARMAAGGKDVSLMGSAAVQQCLRAGLLDEIEVHLVPVLLGGGVRLLDHIGENSVQLERLHARRLQFRRLLQCSSDALASSAVRAAQPVLLERRSGRATGQPGIERLDERARIPPGTRERAAAGEQQAGHGATCLQCFQHDRPEVLNVLGKQPSLLRSRPREQVAVGHRPQIRSLGCGDDIVPELAQRDRDRRREHLVEREPASGRPVHAMSCR